MATVVLVLMLGLMVAAFTILVRAVIGGHAHRALRNQRKRYETSIEAKTSTRDERKEDVGTVLVRAEVAEVRVVERVTRRESASSMSDVEQVPERVVVPIAALGLSSTVASADQEYAELLARLSVEIIGSAGASHLRRDE